jgi:hypothetical protein
MMSDMFEDNSVVPTGLDVADCANSRHCVPGYYHSVPTGRIPLHRVLHLFRRDRPPVDVARFR